MDCLEIKSYNGGIDIQEEEEKFDMEVLFENKCNLCKKNEIDIAKTVCAECYREMREAAEKLRNKKHKEQMDKLKITFSETKLDEDLTETEKLSKHIQIIYDNQKNMFVKLEEMKSDYDEKIKVLEDELDFIMREYAKAKNRIYN